MSNKLKAASLILLCCTEHNRSVIARIPTESNMLDSKAF